MDNDFDKITTLNNINEWIRNCDTKVSIVLGIYGVVLSLLFTSDFKNYVYKIVYSSLSVITIFNITFFIVFVLLCSVFICGLYRLISVLIPKIDLTYSSTMFFAGVSTYDSCEDYKNAVNQLLDEDIENDYLQQIYAAARICSTKFRNQKKGLEFTLLSILVFIIWYIVGFIAFYII